MQTDFAGGMVAGVVLVFVGGWCLLQRVLVKCLSPETHARMGGGQQGTHNLLSAPGTREDRELHGEMTASEAVVAGGAIVPPGGDNEIKVVLL